MADAWEWDKSSNRYRNAASGVYMSASRQAELRDDFLNRMAVRMADATDKMLDHEMRVAEWEREAREVIRLSHVTEWAFARGGRHMLTAAERAELGVIVREQWGYLHRFASAVLDGGMSDAQIRARAALYASAAVLSYERGRAAAFGLTLPAYPGDGTSECLVNCRCTWRIDELDDKFEAYWERDPGDSCETCLRRARDWNPYVVEKPSEQEQENDG
jgi:hypothetical protein